MNDGAALSRFQRPAERAVYALGLQRAERAAQTQSLARRGVDDLQVLNRAAVLQPLAKAAAGTQLYAEVGGVARKGVRGVPPVADLAERGIDPVCGGCDRARGRDPRTRSR